jgi:CDP-diacylglycerol--glycerol-3-phosphate 3-phosphatidyltransferase
VEDPRPSHTDSWVRHIPNALTLARLAIVPIFAWIVADAGGPTRVAGLLFVAAALTDLADGAVARRFGVMSQIGKVLDPLADRLLICTAVILLSYYDDRLPWWAVVAVLWRDALAVLGFVIVRRQILPDVNLAGKAGTMLMMAGLAALFLFSGEWSTYLFWSGFVLSVIALAEYVARYWKLVRKPPTAQH